MALNAFTDLTTTRHEAGFENNANVTDPTIQRFVDAANGELATAIAARYTLPLAGVTYDNSLTQKYLAQLATNLAAGLLLLQQYEGQGGDMEDLAIAKIETTRSQLKEIQKGKRSLIGSDGKEFDLLDAALDSVDGFPDGSTDSESVYSMDDVF